MCVIAETPLPGGLETLVEDLIANIGKPIDIPGFYCFDDLFWGVGVLANQPTVHKWRVSRGRVCGC